MGRKICCGTFSLHEISSMYNWGFIICISWNVLFTPFVDVNWGLLICSSLFSNFFCAALLAFTISFQLHSMMMRVSFQPYRMLGPNMFNCTAPGDAWPQWLKLQVK
jgi:hypothetical protein